MEELTGEEAIEEDVVEEQKLSTYFTFKTGCNLILGSFDFYVILHTEKGELIDFKPFNYLINESLEFKALENETPDDFTVTVFIIGSEGENPGYSLSSISQFKKGETLDYSCEAGNLSAKTGSFNLVVDNIPNVNGVVTGFSAWNGETSGLLAPGKAVQGNLVSYFGDFDILESKRDYIISVQDGNQNSKYYVLSNYNVGDSLKLDYSNFSNYDKYLEIDYPQHYGLSFSLIGSSSEPKESYALSSIFSTAGLEGVLRAGELNRFDSYDIKFSIKPTPKYEYRYRKVGELPDVVVIPEQPLMSIEDASITNFKFNINLTGYLLKTSYWTNLDGASIKTWTWSVQSKENHYPTIGELPDELLEQYPNLDLEDLRFTQTTFRLNDQETITLWNPN
ncbi:hypothetical protein [Costertonia aggregata]|uniref:Uncharacterized protein n=1 Tax=Costertonia aggregata TaxID=343403 RepID=A0A7H9AM58_9FLAO|nr:hypothetical protein [Costertonia aggregata]QLG44464.1 hypothetical protein HYG79_03580 [Costertonia aggregata]